MKSYKYYVLDVFTIEKFKGNQLAVILTDGDLDLLTYEHIAREFGYSETSFIYYSEKDKALRVRSFTPTGFEVNGAGHNLLGAVCAALLTDMPIFDQQEGEPFVIMKDDVTYLSLNFTENNLPFVGMRQNPAVIKAFVQPEIIAQVLNLDVDQIVTGDLSPTVVETEATHLMVPLKSLESLNAASADKKLLIQLANQYQFEGVYSFTILDPNSPYYAQSRFFNPGIGIEEDPATGSAAGPLAGLLFENGFINHNKTYQLLQGVKMNRPSVIRFEVKTSGIWISGSSVIVMEGTLYE